MESDFEKKTSKKLIPNATGHTGTQNATVLGGAKIHRGVTNLQNLMESDFEKKTSKKLIPNATGHPRTQNATLPGGAKTHRLGSLLDF